MRMNILITTSYEVTDDPTELQRIYGTTDPLECAKVDQENEPEDLLSFSNRNSIHHEVWPDLPGYGPALHQFARWIVSFDDPEGPGFEAYRAVTMRQIIDRAREALDMPEEI